MTMVKEIADNIDFHVVRLQYAKEEQNEELIKYHTELLRVYVREIGNELSRINDII